MPEEIDRYSIPADGPAGFKDYLRGLERRIADLEGSRPTGDFVSKDADGNVRLRVGLQDDGTYDAVIFDPTNTGQGVKLSSLAFGIRSHEEAALVTANVYNVWADLGGPTVSVTVGTSGRVLVVGSAVIQAATQLDAYAGKIGVSVDGGTPTDLAKISTTLATTGVAPSITGAAVLESVTPGVRSLKMLYMKDAAADDVQFFDRVIIAWPL